MSKIYLATTNPGKLREFQEAAQQSGVELESLPGLESFPPAIEDGLTFEENARIKAEHYSRFLSGELIAAEDSGLAVEQLNGAPGVYSARYALLLGAQAPSPAAPLHGQAPGHTNSDDEENNRALVSQLERLPAGKHAGKYVCVIALAREGETIACFTGESPGELLTKPRGTGGFGYDPLFFFPSLDKTFAELTLEQKRQYSHRGQAFRQLLDWYSRQPKL